MMYRFYNHTPIALMGHPNVDNSLTERDAACEAAAAAIFTAVFESSDPRIYNYLKAMIQGVDHAHSPVQFAKHAKEVAERVKVQGS